MITRHPNAVEELLNCHLVKKTKPSDTDDSEPFTVQRRRTSTRWVVLSLYPGILRATRLFPWMDEHGELRRDRLLENGRKEFEEARFKTEPEVITQQLVGSRDAVQAALDRLVQSNGGGGEQQRSSKSRT